MNICPRPPDWDEVTPLARRTTWVLIGLFLLAMAATGVHQLVDTWISADSWRFWPPQSASRCFLGCWWVYSSGE